MKKIVTVTEVEGEGLLSLLGKKVVVYCLNYIYAGTLEGVNQSCILLSNGGIVYDTGPHDAKSFSDFQKIKEPIYIQIGSIESFSETGKL